MRRASNQSVDSLYSEYGNDSVALAKSQKPSSYHGEQRAPRRASSLSVDSMASHYANDSVVVNRKHIIGNGNCSSPVKTRRGKLSRRWSTQSYTSNSGRDSQTLVSMAEDSVGLAQKRKDGQGFTRTRNFGRGGDDDSDLDCGNGGGRFAYDYDVDVDDDSSLSLTPSSSDDEFDCTYPIGPGPLATLPDKSLRR